VYWAPPDPKTPYHMSRKHGKESRAWSWGESTRTTLNPHRGASYNTVVLSQYQPSCHKGRDAGGSDEKQCLTPAKKGAKWLPNAISRRPKRKKRRMENKAFYFEAQTNLHKNLNPDHFCMSLIWHVFKCIKRQKS
jgi:hypothetical protein